MSARKKTKKSPPKVAQAAPIATSSWPAEFVPKRSAVLASFCVAGWGLILGMLATGNNLLGLKQACMILAGARLEPMLMVESLHSMDIAAVLFAFVVILGAGYIHASLGLAALLAIRPWLDGYVYELDNLYFLWATMLLLGIWALRQWASPKPVRGLLPVGLVVAYGMVAAFGVVGSYQLDTTFRELLFQVYYAAVLLLAVNVVESRVTRNIVMCGFFAGMAGQALYAYPYLACVLPWMRQEMAADPRRLSAFFQGATEFSPEIARRFNMNRASASMVHPNALAALLILGIPGCLTLSFTGWKSLREAAESTPRVTAFRYSIPAAVALFSVIALGIFMVGQLAIAYQLKGHAPWFGGERGLLVLCIVTAASGSVAFLFCARRSGIKRAGQWLGVVCTTLLFPVMLGALWITYSRGAMLALMAAVVFGAILTRGRTGAGRFGLRRLAGMGRVTATGVVLIGLGLSVAFSAALIPAPEVRAQAAVDAPPSVTAVTGEGIDVSVADLANPASFRLRLSYWRVALSMIADNWLTGVGLGNFKYAYPIYQYLGAGDVQNAHNGVLQAWCETGIFGLAALLAFWGVLFLRGARAVRKDGVLADRPLVLAMLVGLAAFFLHALLDMNLTHPTLVTFAMVAASVLIRTSDPDEAPDRMGPYTRAFTMALLAVVVIASGLALRPYLQQIGMNGGKFLGIDNRDMVNRRFDAASFLVETCAGWARAGKKDDAPAIGVQDLVSLIGDRSELFALGRLLILDPASGQYMRIREDAPIPPGAVLQVTRPWDAHTAGFEILQTWLAELERLDAHSPYDPELALLIGRGYKLLVEQTGKLQMERREQLRTRMQYWGEASVRRSPERADLYQFLAWVQWTSGTFTKGQESLSYFESALESFARSVELAPNVPNYLFAYGHALAALGTSYENAGQPAQAAKYSARSADTLAAGTSLQERRWALGLD